MSHLGDRVTDLVDGQLGPEATERAHAHLAGCRPCREVVEAERLMKSRLASLPEPMPSPDLMGRLLAVGRQDAAAGSGPARSPLVVRAAAGGIDVPSRPYASRPVGSRPAGRPAGGTRPGTGRSRSSRRRLAVAMAGALSVVGVGAGGLAFSSTAMLPGSVVPTVATFFVEHGDTARGVPFVSVPAGWLGGDDGDGTGTP